MSSEEIDSTTAQKKRYPPRKIIGSGMMIVGAPILIVVCFIVFLFLAPFVFLLFAVALTASAAFRLHSPYSPRFFRVYGWLIVATPVSAAFMAILLLFIVASDEAYFLGPLRDLNWIFCEAWLIPQLLWVPAIRAHRVTTLAVAVMSVGLGAVTVLGFPPSQAVTDFVLSKYGVTYEVSAGEHAEYQTIHFILDHNGKHIDGPWIWGDEIYLAYQYSDRRKPPEIVVRSATLKEERATLRLNLTNRSAPEFEMIESSMRFEYPPPWADFYDQRKETGAASAKEQ